MIKWIVKGVECGHYLQEKTGAYFTEMWLFFVVLLLQVSEKLPLKPVDVLYVTEDGLQLQLSEHVGVFTALTDVTLKVTQNQYADYTDRRYENSSNTGQQEVLDSQVTNTKYFTTICRHILERRTLLRPVNHVWVKLRTSSSIPRCKY